MNKYVKNLIFILSICFILSGCSSNEEICVPESDLPVIAEPAATVPDVEESNFDLSNVPEYTNEPYTVINGNVPYFTETEITTETFEEYSELDSFGRCGVAYANLSRETMPTEERGKIGMIKPSGWQTAKYDFVDGKYLYNRCHLIGFQLAGENANEKNLITGTRSMNVQGMLPFENDVADYIENSNNHVLYRVTPVYDGSNLVASGVLMEAYSVEDSGKGICFNVFCYNVEPGVTINYSTGDNWLTGENSEPDTVQETSNSEVQYIINKNSRVFHIPTCGSVDDMKPQNKKEYTGSKEQLISENYKPCGRCNP